MVVGWLFAGACCLLLLLWFVVMLLVAVVAFWVCLINVLLVVVGICMC